MDSILLSVKKMLGIDADYNHFDQDLIMHINSVLMILAQLGIGPAEGCYLDDCSMFTTTWSDFLGDFPELQAVKSYVYLKVRMLFDPPSSSAVIESYNNLIKELEWRLNVAREGGL